MAQTKLEVLIDAKVSEAVNAINEVNKRLDTLKDLQEKNAKAAEEMGRGFASSIKQLSIGVTIANLATDAIRGLISSSRGFISESIQVANSVERVNATLIPLAQNTGRTREEIERIRFAIREENKSLLEATEVTRGIIIAGLNEVDALRLVKVARDVGATAGINSARVNRLVLDSILTLNPGLLKQAGIAISLRVAFKDMADQLGKNVAKLTTAEKQTAVFNEVMREGAKFAGAYEAAMTTVEKITRSVADASADVKLVIGDLLNDAMRPIAQSALDAVRAFRGWAFTAENALRPELVELARQIGTVVLGAFRATVALVKIVTQLFRNLIAVMKERGNFEALAKVLRVVGGAIAFVINQFVDFISVLSRSKEAMRTVLNVGSFILGLFLIPLLAALAPVLIALAAFAAVALVIAFNWKRLNEVFLEFFLNLQTGFPNIRKTVIDWAITTVKAVETVALAIGDAGLVAQTQKAQLALLRMRIEARKDAQTLAQLKQIAEETGGKAFDLGEFFRKAGKEIREAGAVSAVAWREPIPVIDEVSESIEKAMEKMKEFGDVTDRELDIITSLWNDFIKQIEIFDITTKEGLDRFSQFLKDTEFDIEEFADVFRANQQKIIDGFDEMISESKIRLDDLARQFTRTQEDITRIIERNTDEQRKLQIRSQEDVAKAVIKAEEDVAALREKIEARRLELADKIGKEETKFDRQVAFERAAIEKLKQKATEQTGQAAIAIQEEIAGREARIARIVQQKGDAINNVRSEEQAKIKAIEVELIKRQEIFARAAQLDIEFINAINEAREVAKLNEIDRILFEANKRQVARQASFAAEKAQLNNRLANIIAEQAAVSNQLADLMAKREATEKFITDLLKENLIARTEAIQAEFEQEKALIDDIEGKWVSLGRTIRDTLAAVTRVRPLGVPAPAIAGLQAGGIVTKPTIALLGERGAEAVVPLRGGGAPGVINISITGNTIFSDDVERLAKQVGDAIIRRLNLNIRIA